MFDSDGEEEVTLTINEKFADKYEKRKQNEELTRCKCFIFMSKILFFNKIIK